MFITLTAELDNPERWSLEVHQGSPSRRMMGRILLGTPHLIPTTGEVSLWIAGDTRVGPLPPNDIAQLIWHAFGGPTLTGVRDASWQILGNMVICGPLTIGAFGRGWVAPLTQEIVDRITTIGERINGSLD